MKLTPAIRAALAEIVAAADFNDGQIHTKQTFVDLWKAADDHGIDVRDYREEYDRYTEDIAAEEAVDMEQQLAEVRKARHENNNRS